MTNRYDIVRDAHKRAIARRRAALSSDGRPCKTCGIRPRKISASGKALMWCDQCAKAYWKQKKSKPSK